MDIKIYVREYRHKNADGDRLVRVKTYYSKPQRTSYVVWK